VRVAVLNGPNLNLVGTREPHIYGRDTLSDIERAVRDRAEERGVDVSWYQTNHEGEFVELIQSLPGSVDGALINAAALTHTSLAVRDSLLAVDLRFVEIHLSNIFAREEKRRHSLLADLAIGVIAGFGVQSYLLGLEALLSHLESHSN
jgi:3-dehydroquinate dehydratase-2